MSTLFPPKLKLHHRTPGWVPDGEVFHIRLRVAAAQRVALTSPILAAALLDSVRFYEEHGRWHCLIFVLMPDHLHALLAFPPPSSMSRTIGDWKKFHTQRHHVLWQDGYFDHRIRDNHEFEAKAAYIRSNPVAKGLCACSVDWPWVVDARNLAVNRRRI